MGEGLRKALLLGAVLVSTVGAVSAAFWGGLEGGDVLWPVTWSAWAPVGALILWKRPGNGVGRAMLAIGLISGVSFLAQVYAFSPAPLGARVWVELVNLIAGTLPWIGIVWMILIFPSGRLQGRLERATGLGLLAVAVLAVISFSVSSVPMDATGQPSPLAAPWFETLTDWFVSESGFVVVIFLTLLSITALAIRWRRSQGMERHQYRWLLLGALIFLVILALGQVLPEDNAALYLLVVSGAAIPVSVGIAVSRYRLYEIDRLLSRTVTYAFVAGAMGALFAITVVGLPNWIPGVDESPLLVAAATLGVAALFNPLRRRVQMLVDRRFNRSRYDAEQVMEGFVGSLRDQLDASGIAEGWTVVVSETMQPSAVGVWVRS